MRTALLTVLALAAVAPASAAWSVDATGTAAAAAKTMPAGSAATATAAAFTVTVSWSASSFAGGGAVAGYRVRRFDVLGAATNAGGGCGGVVAASSCVETGVPTGTWRYAVTPVAGSWNGAEGPQSAAVVVPGL